MDVIHEAVKKYDKNLVLKDKQREALTYVVKSKCDLVVSLPVGYGKNVIFHLLPFIFEETRENPVVLVISPLNIIQKDQLSVHADLILSLMLFMVWKMIKRLNTCAHLMKTSKM